MLRFFIKLCLFCSLLISANAFTMPYYIDEEKNIDSFIQNFLYAYEKRELNQLMEYYAPNAVVIGTGSDEILMDRNEIMDDFRRDFFQSTNAHIDSKKISINIINNIALVSYLLNVNVEMPNHKSFQSQLRFSAGLIKYNEKWLIVQSHLSAPLAEQKTGQVFPDE